MATAPRLLLALGLAALSASGFAATTVYTAATPFASAVAAGAYVNDFAGLGPTPPSTFSSGGFAYTIAATDGLYANGDFIGTNLPAEALTLTFTGAAVTALGGDFYASDISDAFQATSITLTLSDGTTVAFSPTSAADSFRGFVSTTAITSLTMSAPAGSLYANLDNLTVGVAAVPEPGSLALLALGLGALGLVARSRRGVRPQ